MLENWLLNHPWAALIALPLLFWRQILDAITAPGETLQKIRGWTKRTEPLSLQYSSVRATIDGPNQKRFIGVAPRVFLDNPHPFPVRWRLDTMATTVNFIYQSDLSDQKREDVIGAGARNFVVELGETRFELRPDQDSIPIRLIWEFRYGRADLSPDAALDHFLRISGELSLKLFTGRYESRWKEDSYSAPPVQLPPDTVAEDSLGELHRG
jgi:hypothetical protein